LTLLEELELELEQEIIEKQARLNEVRKNLGVEKTELEKATELFERVEKKPKYPRYGTGISILDTELNGGFMLGSFINIAGNNFAGKTTLLLKILTNIARGHKIVFFSFEMYENLLKRKIEHMSKDYNTLNNILIEQKNRKLNDIEETIKEQAKAGVKIFGIDSIMKIETNEKEEYKSASLISNRLSKLTQELGIIIFLINQISEGDQRQGRLAFKRSGDIQYDSDCNLFVIVKLNEKTGEVTERKLWCKKDRVNEKTWIKDIPDFGSAVSAVNNNCIEIPYVA